MYEVDAAEVLLHAMKHLARTQDADPVPHRAWMLAMDLLARAWAKVANERNPSNTRFDQ